MCISGAHVHATRSSGQTNVQARARCAMSVARRPITAPDEDAQRMTAPRWVPTTRMSLFMLPARRLPAVGVCLPIIGAMLCSATIVASAASAHRPRATRAAISSHSYKQARSRAGRRRRSRAQRPPSRWHRCVAPRGPKHRRAGGCTVKHPHKSAVKPRGRRPSPGPAPSPSAESPGPQPPASGSAPPTDVPAPGSKPGSSSSGPPSGSSTSPSGPALPSEPISPSDPVAPGEPTASAPFRFFSPTGFWNEPLLAGAPLDASSAATVGAFDEEIAREERVRSGPWIDTTVWSVPIYTVPADQPPVQVQIIDNAIEPALQSAWSAVPLPPDARPASGTDGHLVVWQPSTDRLWEFWRLAHGAEGWHASWGGAMQDVSSNRESSTRKHGRERSPGGEPPPPHCRSPAGSSPWKTFNLGRSTMRWRWRFPMCAPGSMPHPPSGRRDICRTAGPARGRPSSTGTQP